MELPMGSPMELPMGSPMELPMGSPKLIQQPRVRVNRRPPKRRHVRDRQNMQMIGVQNWTSSCSPVDKRLMWRILDQVVTNTLDRIRSRSVIIPAEHYVLNVEDICSAQDGRILLRHLNHVLDILINSYQRPVGR
mmetsp:Transcript_47/g.34  ORF Transcript_47/g.34 Transcript_47/m.34 type:complete len:135 (-) Transcript_47:77-481(-)